MTDSNQGFTKEQVEHALKLPRNIKRRLSPEDRARNEKHLQLAADNGANYTTRSKSMATFNDEGELASLDDVEWYGIDGLPELGLYQNKDEAALAFCRHNSLGEFEAPRDAGVVDQHIEEHIVEGAIQPIKAGDIRVQDVTEGTDHADKEG